MTDAVDAFILTFNRSYEEKHKAYEDNFWSTKMNLKGNSTADLARTKSELDAFLGDAAALATVRDLLSPDSSADERQREILRCFERTLLCYIVEDQAVKDIKDRLNDLEASLAASRNHMKLGYLHPDSGLFVAASSVQLRNTMRTSSDERQRAACLNAMREVEAFVVQPLCEIVRLRNRMARSLGYEDFYDMKVSQAEGFGKSVLFGVLDQLERDTRPLLVSALNRLASERGPSALLPENTAYMLSGDVAQLKDPYFPFEDSVDMWTRSFAALGISYRGSTMRLDLCDRPGKYSNGFCHWPQPAWRTPSGEWVPSQANFTSLASPSAVGSGHTALVTLMHEGGHAAHFANVDQGSPLFSQERAPTSVAYAENQSMFLDSLVGDAAWVGRYARSREGLPMPWNILEQEIRDIHPYEVFALRAMLAVPYFEKRLYELPEDQLTSDSVLALAASVEIDIQGTRAGRPLLSVPHILSDESAAYYHGYVLAEMSVHQTRAHFMSKYGSIVDNPLVGRDLAEVYWRPGNKAMFLDLVQQLTGSPLSSSAWVDKLRVPVDAVLAEERAAYDEALAKGPRFERGTAVDLDMRVMLVHGDEVVADSGTAGLAAACAAYKHWIATL